MTEDLAIAGLFLLFAGTLLYIWGPKMTYEVLTSQFRKTDFD